MKIFDAHFHIIDYNYPIVENNGFLPSEFTISAYRERTQKLNLVGGAVVSGSFQAFDQDYIMDSLQKLGDNYHGVANIPANLTDAELEALDAQRVLAVRFNLQRGGSETVAHLDKLSNKLYEKYGWHTELYVDNSHLIELTDVLKKLKRFSIDHLGLSAIGLKDLYYWVEKGARVKATGFGRLDFDPISAMQQIHKINPEALLFGTDLPSTRANIPFSANDILKIQDNFNEDDQEMIFYKNALKWYKKDNS